MMQEVSFIITYNCPLSCSMCLQRSPFRKEFIKRFPSTMALEDWESVVDQLEEYRDSIQYIYLTGGECFSIPYIYELIQYMKMKNYIVSANTNGMCLVHSIDKLIETGIDFIILSIDGSEQIHNKIRGNTNSYKSTISVIEQIRKQRKGFKPRIFVNCVIQEDNYMYLEEYVDELMKCGADQVFFHLQMFISEELSDMYEKQYQNLFKIQPFSQKGAIAKPNINTEQLRRTIERLQIKYKNVHTLHNFNKVNLSEYFHYPENQFRMPQMKACYAANNILEIAPDGSVITCHDFPDYIAGNVRESKLKDIWEGEKIKKFRNLTESGQLLKICHRCCMSERYATYNDGSSKVKGAFRNETK